MRPDVVVLGAGVIGASIAYHLARGGARVMVVDRVGPAAAPGASWASAGGLRSQGRSPAEHAITVAAAARWPTLALELDADLEAGFDGHLHLAEAEPEVATIERRIAQDRAGGIAIERVSGNDIARLAPALTRRALLGAFTPGDGQAHPARTARAFVAAAVRAGTATRFGEVARIDAETGAAVLTVGADRLSVGRIVLAGGAWSVAMLDRLGLVLPLRWRGLTMLLSEVAAPLLGPTVTAVGRNLSLKQSPSGQMMVGGRWLAEPVAGAVEARPVAADVAPQWAGAVALVPAMAPLGLAQTWAGVEAQAVDSMPFLGPAPLRNLYVATGFSNHGFQISPEVGARVADDLLAGDQPLLAPFRLDRAVATDPAGIARFRSEPLRP